MSDYTALFKADVNELLKRIHGVISTHEAQEILDLLAQLEARDKLNRSELIQAVVEEYMNNLLDNPEVVRDALLNYFDGFDNETLANTLKGF